jgi:photosystem II stability/assembly factor-like uncharacterized protein
VTGVRIHPRSELEDWLTELPPLDGADDEPAAEDASDELIPDGDENASLDDANADDLDVDEGVEITEEEPAAEDDERWEADVGEPELDLEGVESAGPEGDAPLEAPGSEDGDLDIDDDLPASDEDAGEEGTSDPIEHSLDEELPALDADDEGDFEDDLLREVQLAASPKDTPRWADVLWEQTRPSRPLAWPLAEDDTVVAMSAAVAANSYVLAAASDGAVLLASLADSKTKFAARVVHPPVDDGGPLMLALSGAGHPAIWVSTRAGELAKSTDLGETWVRCAALGRPILALASREDGSVSVLARKGDAAELLTSADGTRWFAQRVTLELQTESHDGRVWVAHRGAAIAVGDAGGVSSARDGRHFTRLEGSAGATAGTFAGTTADAPLLLAGALIEGDDDLHLARVPRDGAVEIVAEIKPPVSDDEVSDLPRVWLLAWHDESQSVSVGLAGHLSTWAPRSVKSAR